MYGVSSLRPGVCKTYKGLGALNLRKCRWGFIKSEGYAFEDGLETRVYSLRWAIITRGGITSTHKPQGPHPIVHPSIAHTYDM